MKVAFLKGNGIVDYLIRIWTLSKYSHCELVFSNGDTFGSSLVLPFKTEFCHREYSTYAWDIVEVNLSVEKENQIRKFCATQVGKSYDWKAIFLSMIIPLRQDSPDKYICSEICVAAFKHIGMFEGVNPCRISPGKFHKMLKK